jgi:nucleotide-binding universal stress UspA family protein
MNVSPTKILWPTDFSPLSMKAADYARGFQEMFGADLHIVHVSQPPVIPPPGFPSLSPADLSTWQTEQHRAAHSQLQRLANELFKGERVKIENLAGNPWHEICEYARRNGVDLIIIATHGLTGLKHVLIGSVAERIVQHASCPVLVVKSLKEVSTKA